MGTLALPEYSVTTLDVVHHCDALALLRALPDNFVHCIVTSPPYYGLRNYGENGQIGLEDTPAQYVARLVEVFREAKRVLRNDGTCWVVLGDSYAANRGSGAKPVGEKQKTNSGSLLGALRVPDDLKEKDLIGIPWRVAFALQDDGWWLRNDIIWHKPNPMPESVTDRCTVSHEYVFLLTKAARYWYDADAIREPASDWGTRDRSMLRGGTTDPLLKHHGLNNCDFADIGRNRRTVWTVPTEPKPFQHFAMFPQKLIEPMILAGCPTGGIVLDPFMGSGTTALVAQRLGRHYIGCDLNREYVGLARKRAQYRGDDQRMMQEQRVGVEQLALI